ncbi:leucine aminopeptidase 2 [Coccidioides immitis RS]|uniref:Peptide hydrolase n=1 Tax=Coccidioides immitis (strain RS) TaxID=246410 RepID=A0A0E1RX46_COCIM|nr:leucine aminopeptidase 2 [Coccidioides immitis RS]EAS33494.2 leucine aminopeptidase 2 [Coccidioides immitis RS]
MKTLAVLALSAIVCPSAWALKPVDATEKFLIETAPGETRWVTEAEKFELKELVMMQKVVSATKLTPRFVWKKHIDFFDITDEQDLDFSFAAEKVLAQFPTQLRYVAEAKPLAARLSKDTMRRNLERFSSFHNRYYRSQTGVQSANWLFEQANAIVSNSGAARRGATVRKFSHNFQQPSIIVTIPGRSRNTIVVGAHQDSVNSRSPTNGRAPGADDNGSGSITILDALRALLTSPKIAQGEAQNTIEFHWYAGEEAGLLGSQDIFRRYRSEGRAVKAMLNQDMTGFTRRRESAGLPEAFGVITDNVDAGLSEFCRLVIRGYTDITFVNSSCGYACSDHASATRNGYPSAFIFEADQPHSNPSIHTTNDVIGNVNFDHVEQHGKLVIGFVYELAFTNL